MLVKKIIKQSVDVNIAGVTLLSKEEVVELPKELLTMVNWWWTRTCSYSDDNMFPSDDHYYASVIHFGEIASYGTHDVQRVRPALVLADSDLKNGDVFEFDDYLWTVCLNKYALCNNSIGVCVYRKDCRADDAWDFEKSDVKRFIEDWFRDARGDIKKIADEDVKGVTLLSAEEAGKLPRNRLNAENCSETWWLKSRGSNSTYVACVSDGHIIEQGVIASRTLAVRPALIIDTDALMVKNGDKVEYKEHIWTVSLGRYALCDDFIGSSVFSSEQKKYDMSNYDVSDVKNYINNWLRR